MVQWSMHVYFRWVSVLLIGLVLGCGSVNGGRTQRAFHPVEKNDPMMGTEFLKENK